MPIGRLSKGKNYYHISYIIFQLQHIMTVFLARGHSQNVVESQTEPFFLHSWQIFKIIYNPSFLQDFCVNSNTVIQCNKPALHTKFFQIFITVFLNVNTRKEMSSSTSISLPSFSFFFFFIITSETWPSSWAATSTGVNQCSGIEYFLWATPITTVLTLYPRGYISGNLFKLIDDFFTYTNQFVIVWLFTMLFNQNVFHYHFIFPVWEGSIQTIFNHSSAILQALKKVKFAISWKDISKETGMTMTVTTKPSFLSHIILKVSLLLWH